MSKTAKKERTRWNAVNDCVDQRKQAIGIKVASEREKKGKRVHKMTAESAFLQLTKIVSYVAITPLNFGQSCQIVKCETEEERTLTNCFAKFNLMAAAVELE